MGIPSLQGGEDVKKRLILVCQELTPGRIGNILVLPWREFLELLWSDAYSE
jgi:hypothetical protein